MTNLQKKMICFKKNDFRNDFVILNLITCPCALTYRVALPCRNGILFRQSSTNASAESFNAKSKHKKLK